MGSKTGGGGGEQDCRPRLSWHFEEWGKYTVNNLRTKAKDGGLGINEFTPYKVAVEWGRRLIQGWHVKRARVSPSSQNWYIKNANSHTIFKINILINLEFIMFYIIKILRTKSNKFINTYLFYCDLVIMVQTWWNINILLHIKNIILNYEVSLSKNLLSIHYGFFSNNFRRSRLYV